ncbi:hypothetical protein PT974_03655 [Cladobotryum mycophilum]|uniref:VWFA domain-containing protein n=1 Tax=Cladobotryum mycophilum TaxID=491253 RepID=A0ABR0SU59_9HYPO
MVLIKKQNTTSSNGQQQDVPILNSNAINQTSGLPDHPPSYSLHDGPVGLQLHHIASKDALVVKVQPPQAPEKELHHVPCDIVLVIDVSGSMGTAAPVPGEDASEDTGLSVLDLTKHAAYTIIETMNEGDRLGIVTFCTKSKVVQTLQPMTLDKKEQARKRIKALRPIDSTNLWHGILDGVKLFDKGQSERVPAIMVLTDGMPNHMSSIHTFGFGYSLRSGLLKSLAEFSGGNYAFIPDAGMIGTVFVHAVANLQSTFASNAKLTLKYAAPVDIQQTMGDSVEKESPKATDDMNMELTIPLGNIQYGQSRDVWLNINKIPNLQTEKSGLNSLIVDATLTFQEQQKPSPITVRASLYRSMLDTSTMSDAEIAYHESRARLCNFLSSLFPIGSDGEHRAAAWPSKLDEKTAELTQLINNLPARNFTDEQNKSLMEDLNGEQPKGQISMALSTSEFFVKWGQHFLPSYLNAHTRQICNSFKDSGPLQYSVNSPLFAACRTRLDDIFDNLPAPEPSRTIYSQSGAVVSRGHVSMARYRNSGGVCFAGSTPVELASGRTMDIRKLKRGMKVRTPVGVRKVAMVLKTSVTGETLCRMGSLLVTPWHPISVDGKTWDFPANRADKAVLYTGAIYSVLLQQDGNSSAHAIRVAGTWGVTLGHGVTRGNDVRAHEFFGDYMRVAKGLMTLPSAGRVGVVLGQGVKRDENSGMVSGFMGSGAKLAVPKGLREKTMAARKMIA